MKSGVAQLISAVVVTLIIIVLLFIFVPWYQAASIANSFLPSELEKDVLKTIAQTVRWVVSIAVPLLSFAGFYLRWKRLQSDREGHRIAREGHRIAREGHRIALKGQQIDREGQQVTREGQMAERYSRAIEQLNNAQGLDGRTAAIYELRDIAQDSCQHHGPTMEILTAYVREHAPWEPPPEDQQPAAGDPYFRPPSPTEDIQAVIAVREQQVPDLAPDIQAALTVIGRAQD